VEPTGSFSFQEKPSWQSLDFQCSPPGQSPECASKSLLTEFRILEQNSQSARALILSQLFSSHRVQKKSKRQLTELKGKEGLVTILLKVLKKDEL
jgi:hypothetical protein